MGLVSTQKLTMYSISAHGKLTLPQGVVGKLSVAFPPELRNAGRATLNMFSQGPNVGILQFLVTASLQKQGQNGWRVVLLESGWKPVVRELQLREGDTVRIFLLDNMAWTYSIQVQRAQAPARMEFDLNEPAQPNMEINLNQPNQPALDLVNEPAGLNMEINLNQPNQPAFDLNEPADPNMEINLNDDE